MKVRICAHAHTNNYNNVCKQKQIQICSSITITYDWILGKAQIIITKMYVNTQTSRRRPGSINSPISYRHGNQWQSYEQIYSLTTKDKINLNQF